MNIALVISDILLNFGRQTIIISRIIMANKKSLKRGINLICEELFTECVAASLYGAERHKDNAEALLSSIIRLQSDFICRVSHPEPGMPPKLFYKTLRQQFSAQVGEIVDHINTL